MVFNKAGRGQADADRLRPGSPEGTHPLVRTRAWAVSFSTAVGAFEPARSLVGGGPAVRRAHARPRTAL